MQVKRVTKTTLIILKDSLPENPCEYFRVSKMTFKTETEIFETQKVSKILRYLYEGSYISKKT